MEFGGEIGLWQQKIAEGSTGTARSLAVVEALAINTSQAVLNLGCKIHNIQASPYKKWHESL